MQFADNWAVFQILKHVFVLEMLWRINAPSWMGHMVDLQFIEQSQAHLVIVREKTLIDN
jgi:hypothetical protein